MKNLVFPVEEYLQRVEKTRKSMQEHGIDVLIVTDPRQHELSHRL